VTGHWPARRFLRISLRREIDERIIRAITGQLQCMSAAS
jgi:hypothetical protein